jgi:MoaA/NifB/PqqE/SkfB family radical SAM enzyme
MSKKARVPLANFMGQAGFGSFAPVGERLVSDPKVGGPRHYLAVEIGEACQLKCRHCIYHRPKSRNPRPNAEVLEEVYETVHTGYNPIWVTFAGKEATIYPRTLVETATRLRRPDTFSILMTNGLLLKDALIDSLADKIDLFDISLDGPKVAHDWMRGSGTYERTWERIGAVLDRTASRVGIIATAVRGEVEPGVQQYEQIGELADEIVTRCGTSGRVVLTLSLYFGPVADPMLLRPDDIAGLVRTLSATGCPSRVLFTANYAHQWPEVAAQLGLTNSEVRYDAGTGLPVVQFGSVNLILFNLTEVPQISARVSNDGLVFVGCNHLVLGDAAASHAVGDLGAEPLRGILERLSNGQHAIYDHFRDPPAACGHCPVFAACRAGDRLSGLLFDMGAVDPYCTRIKRSPPETRTLKIEPADLTFAGG